MVQTLITFFGQLNKEFPPPGDRRHSLTLDQSGPEPQLSLSIWVSLFQTMTFYLDEGDLQDPERSFIVIRERAAKEIPCPI